MMILLNWSLLISNFGPTLHPITVIRSVNSLFPFGPTIWSNVNLKTFADNYLHTIRKFVQFSRYNNIYELLHVSMEVETISSCWYFYHIRISLWLLRNSISLNSYSTHYNSMVFLQCCSYFDSRWTSIYNSRYFAADYLYHQSFYLTNRITSCPHLYRYDVLVIDAYQGIPAIQSDGVSTKLNPSDSKECLELWITS